MALAPMTERSCLVLQWGGYSYFKELSGLAKAALSVWELTDIKASFQFFPFKVKEAVHSLHVF